MILFQIAKDIWTISAYAKEGGKCQVLDFLDDGSKYEDEKIKMFALLNRVATHGPKLSGNFSKPLSGNIFEFKRVRKKGPGIRVFYFFDENKIIICTYAFMKRDKTPQNRIRDAEEIRAEYLKDKRDQKIKIIDREKSDENKK